MDALRPLDALHLLDALYPYEFRCFTSFIVLMLYIRVWPFVALYSLVWPCFIFFGLLWCAITLYGLIICIKISELYRLFSRSQIQFIWTCFKLTVGKTNAIGWSPLTTDSLCSLITDDFDDLRLFFWYTLHDFKLFSFILFISFQFDEKFWNIYP